MSGLLPPVCRHCGTSRHSAGSAGVNPWRASQDTTAPSRLAFSGATRPVRIHPSINPGRGEAMDADFQAMRDLADAAALPEGVRHTLAWCLGQLPPLYRELRRTYDSRHGDEIQRLVRGMLQALAGPGAASPDAPRVAEAITGRLRAMHERLGIPRLGFTLPGPARKARPRKTG